MLDFLGGCREDRVPGAWESVLNASWFKAVWWIFLVGVVLVFSGQTSKFIYIDF